MTLGHGGMEGGAELVQRLLFTLFHVFFFSFKSSFRKHPDENGCFKSPPFFSSLKVFLKILLHF